MHQFARWHIWLAWLFGVPLLLWVLTGLIMVARPIEEVRGEHLRAKPAAVNPAGLVMPRLTAPVNSVALIAQPDGPVWIVTEPSGKNYRYSAQDGMAKPSVIETEAAEIAESAYTGDAELEKTIYFPAGDAPSDYRGGNAAWQVRFADGTHIYIGEATGEVLALRTKWWRTYDFMWGLHIMDLQTREDSHHPLLIIFAVISLIGTILGVALMFRGRKAKAKDGGTEP